METLYIRYPDQETAEAVDEHGVVVAVLKLVPVDVLDPEYKITPSPFPESKTFPRIDPK